MNTADGREAALFREPLQQAKGPEREAFLHQACARDQTLRGRLQPVG